MKSIAILLLFIPMSLWACSKDKSEGEPVAQNNYVQSNLPPHIKSGYQLVWSDEFDGTTVNLSKWNYRAEGTVRNYGTVSRQTISLDGKGNVSIKVTKDSNGKYLIGELGTSGIYDPTYGYFECRAQMNKTMGPHVAFWMQSNDLGKTLEPVKDGTEIDIFEYHRKSPGIVFHNLHWDGYGVNHKTTGKQVPTVGIETGFHTFGLEWTKDVYVFYVDGKETWRTTSAVSQRSEYLILSTELTGWGGDPALGIFPDEVLFDYVRVYQPKK
jgi:beta-glucanase (GH16 family)